MGKLGRNPFQNSTRLETSPPPERPTRQEKETPSRMRPRSRALKAERGLCPLARQAVKLAAGAVVLGFKGTILAREAVRSTFGV